jgi:hypothetical protein
MADQHETDQTGLLPEPGPSETLRVVMQGSKRGVSWRRLFPPTAVSFGLHLFVLLFVLTMSATARPPEAPSLEHNVTERQPARVGQIIIIGNTVTRQNVILDQLPLYPGQLLTHPGGISQTAIRCQNRR